MEDREGNLWLGSQLNGLARLWNGWTRRYSVGEGLHDPIVWSLSPAADARPGEERIWVGSNDGLSLFDHGHFQLVVPGKALPHPQAYNILSEPGQVWIGTRRGLVVWRDGRPDADPLYAPMASAQINGIVRARDGSLWFPTTNGLFHAVGGRLDRIGQAQGLRDPRVRVIAFDQRRTACCWARSPAVWELRDGKVEPLADQARPADRARRVGAAAAARRTPGGRHAGRARVHRHRQALARARPEAGPAGELAVLPQPRTAHGVAVGRRASAASVACACPSCRPLAMPRPARCTAEMVLNERGDPNSGQQGYLLQWRRHVEGLPRRRRAVAAVARWRRRAGHGRHRQESARRRRW